MSVHMIKMVDHLQKLILIYFGMAIKDIQVQGKCSPQISKLWFLDEFPQ